MTIKDIEKQVEATKEARAQLERSLRDSKDQEKEYRAKADEAAVDGDVVSFKKLSSFVDAIKIQWRGFLVRLRAYAAR